jgi:cold shock CspA family protein
MTISSGPDDAKLITGVVRWYDPNRGYGFVAPSLDAPKHEDAFLHCRALKPAQQSGRWNGVAVEYRVHINPRNQKPEAFDVKLLLS